MENGNDLIIRQAAINAISCDITITGRQNAELVAATIGAFADRIKALPSAQPEITDEQAIEHLQESGWMQNHDKQMYEMGLREQLADDSGSYDALLPSAQTEPAIPISWLEKEIERLESRENSFAVLDAVQLKALIKRWERRTE